MVDIQGERASRQEHASYKACCSSEEGQRTPRKEITIEMSFF
jgi:hypothetical protein